MNFNSVYPRISIHEFRTQESNFRGIDCRHNLRFDMIYKTKTPFCLPRECENLICGFFFAERVSGAIFFSYTFRWFRTRGWRLPFYGLSIYSYIYSVCVYMYVYMYIAKPHLQSTPIWYHPKTILLRSPHICFHSRRCSICAQRGYPTQDTRHW